LVKIGNKIAIALLTQGRGILKTLSDQDFRQSVDGQDPCDAAARLRRRPEVDGRVRKVGTVLGHRPLTEKLKNENFPKKYSSKMLTKLVQFSLYSQLRCESSKLDQWDSKRAILLFVLTIL
jgi:hypothetical protein